jgi:hypothetical protein
MPVAAPRKLPGVQTQTFIDGMRGQLDKLEVFLNKDGQRRWVYEDAIRVLCDRVTDVTDDIVQGNWNEGAGDTRYPTP